MNLAENVVPSRDTGVVLAVDAMGGDDAPRMVITGTEMARKRHVNSRFLIYGDTQRVSPLLEKYPELQAVSEFHHTETVINNEDKPTQALRRSRQSSMYLAIDAVRNGQAEGVISAGNTGALMVLAKHILKTLPGIQRPAIASCFPTQRSESLMLDLGANVECDEQNLVQFALMGAMFVRNVLGIAEPSVGLLNVGIEEVKGLESLKKAANTLHNTSSLPLRFQGFIEGDDITLGTVDVIVTDGFTGNIALKTIEGTVNSYKALLRRALSSSLFGKIGYLFMRTAMKKFNVRIDPRRYNGGILLGLNGICVKSHGGTDAFGFASALSVAIDLVANRFNEKIKQEIQNNSEALSWVIS